jgi:hypothetical protein
VVTFTHIPCVVGPLVVLQALRSSALAHLVPPDGAVINHPEVPWYGPVTPVRADPTHLHRVTVTASTWERHHSYSGRAAALEIRLIFSEQPAQVHEGYSLWASDDRPATLSRVFYDHQRAETGYEGDDRVTSSPSSDEVEDFLLIVRRITGAE